MRFIVRIAAVVVVAAVVITTSRVAAVAISLNGVALEAWKLHGAREPTDSARPWRAWIHVPEFNKSRPRSVE